MPSVGEFAIEPKVKGGEGGAFMLFVAEIFTFHGANRRLIRVSYGNYAHLNFKKQIPERYSIRFDL